MKAEEQIGIEEKLAALKAKKEKKRGFKKIKQENDATASRRPALPNNIIEIAIDIISDDEDDRPSAPQNGVTAISAE